MDDEIANKVIKFNQEFLDNAPKALKQIMQKTNGDIVKKDNDGKYYLHYLNQFELVGNNFYEMQSMYETLCKLIESEIDEQKQNLQKNPDKQDTYQRIIDKYNWLKNYIDSSKPNENSGAITTAYTFK